MNYQNPYMKTIQNSACHALTQYVFDFSQCPDIPFEEDTIVSDDYSATLCMEPEGIMPVGTIFDIRCAEEEEPLLETVESVVDTGVSCGNGNTEVTMTYSFNRIPPEYCTVIHAYTDTPEAGEIDVCFEMPE